MKKSFWIFFLLVIIAGSILLHNRGMVDRNSNQGEVTQVAKEFSQSDEKKGEGAEVKPGDTVKFNYRTFLLGSSKEIDSSYARGQPFEIRVATGQAVRAWDVGLLGMKKGGQRTLIAPPNYAYGAKGAGDGLVPPNASLKYEVELVDIVTQAKK